MNKNYINENVIKDIDFSKIRYLFSPLSMGHYYKLMINTEGVYSITPYKCANTMSQIIFNLFKTEDITIVDSTSNVGGNTISFSKKFNNVISIEKDVNTFLMLKNNIRIYELDKKVKLYNGDCLKIIPNLSEKIDVIFIDPPWGGKSYKKLKSLYLSLSDINIVDVVKTLSCYSKKIAIKIPFNFNFIHFFRNLDYMKFDIYKIHFKYYMLVISK